MAMNLQFSVSHRFPKTVNLPRPQSSHIYGPDILSVHPSQYHALAKLKLKGRPYRPIYAAKSRNIEPVSPVEVLADEFYESLNDKKLNKLQSLISDDCVFEDLAFSKPIKGKEINNFLKKLTEAMGKNIKFIIDEFYESGDYSVAVHWHLEWQNYHIPSASGCSLYECMEKEEKLLIKKATVYVESPLKPGTIVLELLKIISFLFDNFPKQATWFLEKPQVIANFIMKLYKTLVEPFIFPILVYYSHLWTYGARTLAYLLNLLQLLLKIIIR